MSVNSANVLNLTEAVELLLKRGNDLFHCPIVTNKKEDKIESQVTTQEPPQKLESEDDQFELL